MHFQVTCHASSLITFQTYLLLAGHSFAMELCLLLFLIRLELLLVCAV